MAHSTQIGNHLPKNKGDWSPEEMWTGSRSSRSLLKNSQPWGYPCYMLSPKLQDGMKIPKWEPCSRGAQFVGFSPLHSSMVGLVRNLRTGNISPQFHVVYNNYFETVHSDPTRPPVYGQNSLCSSPTGQILKKMMSSIDMNWRINGRVRRNFSIRGSIGFLAPTSQLLSQNQIWIHLCKFLAGQAT